ncbi:uncharacterized protein BO88DRAFT_448310 [Aspergillus vadensis CBS 113365]|uniref:VWFA domain-containing protein n=1 Tax=Aspergillus vadensis (strain CBS 113365 / IMI 142717 / IBT 24658) TaxID=1448311 RepID=A0A319CGP5_ASPVC|nr:hypothetical protein BO88DRAFT_448310 [Aspergillus vadensis CBS 113365]PYH74498.1 hypothetical protein BO88DRAFT_448310 [Aspergillus vadensis CBS 113365]
MVVKPGDGDSPPPIKRSFGQDFFSKIGNKIKDLFMKRMPGFMDVISDYLVKRLFRFAEKLTQRSVPSSKPQEIIENPQTEDDFKKNVDFLVRQSNLGDHTSQLNESYLREVAKKAAQLKNDPKNHLNNPDQITTLTQLALYHPVLYCDDSLSMSTTIKGSDKKRLEALQELVKRIISVATRAVPDNPKEPGEKLEGASLRFINSDAEHTIRKLEDLSQVNYKADDYTPLGTQLDKRILKPFIYDFLDTGKVLPRPLLIFTITDGEPSTEAHDTFREKIVECMQFLTKHEYPRELVNFNISQVGNDSNAGKFLESLKNDNEIQDILHCTAEHLDERFEELRANERDLERWVLEMLSRQIRIKKPEST